MWLTMNWEPKSRRLLKLVDSMVKSLNYMDLGGSEDCSYFMERVQQNGGRAAYLMYGTEIAAGHHNSCFDFDEKCLYKAVAMLTELAIAYTNK